MGAMVPRKVILRGELARNFGPEHRLATETVGETIRALDTNRKGFVNHLRASKKRGIGYAILVHGLDGKRYTLGEHQLHHPLGSKAIEIVPLPAGAGEGGLVQVIMGALLIVAAVILSPLTAGTSLGALSLLSAGQAIGLGLAGASLLAGGVAQLVAGSPSTTIEAQDSAEQPENRASFSFAGPVNTSGQGGAVPLLYGEMIVGSHVISFGIVNK